MKQYKTYKEEELIQLIIGISQQLESLSIDFACIMQQVEGKRKNVDKHWIESSHDKLIRIQSWLNQLEVYEVKVPKLKDEIAKLNKLMEEDIY